MWFDETIAEKYQTIDITLIVRIQWKSILGLSVTSNFYLTILEQYYGLLLSKGQLLQTTGRFSCIFLDFYMYIMHVGQKI